MAFYTGQIMGVPSLELNGEAEEYILLNGFFLDLPLLTLLSNGKVGVTKINLADLLNKRLIKWDFTMEGF